MACIRLPSLEINLCVYCRLQTWFLSTTRTTSTTSRKSTRATGQKSTRYTTDFTRNLRWSSTWVAKHFSHRSSSIDAFFFFFHSPSRSLTGWKRPKSMETTAIISRDSPPLSFRWCRSCRILWTRSSMWVAIKLFQRTIWWVLWNFRRRSTLPNRLFRPPTKSWIKSAARSLGCRNKADYSAETEQSLDLMNSAVVLMEKEKEKTTFGLIQNILIIIKR